MKKLGNAILMIDIPFNILGIVLCVCIYLTGAFGWSMKKASKKRKDKSVHY